MCFSLWLKWLRFCCFRECCFWRDQRSQFQKDTFSKKKNLQWSFEFLSTLCKKVFSGATVKGIFVCGSNNSDSVVFGNTALGDIKDHSLIMTRFEKKKIAVEVLGLCLLYIKRYFQEHQFSGFFFMAEITQILLFSGMPLLERSKIKVWEWQILKKNLLWKFWVCVYLM